jgi:hypothetical protein
LDNKIILLSSYHNDSSERILCAAIWYRDHKLYKNQPKNITDGYVMCGRRHMDIISLHFELTGQLTKKEWTQAGFLTSLNRFVDRKEANEIVIAAKQTKYNKPGEDLISEDLY